MLFLLVRVVLLCAVCSERNGERGAIDRIAEKGKEVLIGEATEIGGAS